MRWCHPLTSKENTIHKTAMNGWNTQQAVHRGSFEHLPMTSGKRGKSNQYSTAFRTVRIFMEGQTS